MALNITGRNGRIDNLLVKTLNGTDIEDIISGGSSLTLAAGTIETGVNTPTGTSQGSGGSIAYGVWEVINDRITWQRVGDTVTGGVVFEITDGTGSAPANQTYIVELPLPVDSFFGNDRGVQGCITGNTGEPVNTSNWSGIIGSPQGGGNIMRCVCFAEAGSVPYRFSGTFSYDVQVEESGDR